MSHSQPAIQGTHSRGSSLGRFCDKTKIELYNVAAFMHARDPRRVIVLKQVVDVRDHDPR